MYNVQIKLLKVYVISTENYYLKLFFFQCSEEAWDKIFDVNVKASFLLAKSVVPHMQNQGKGSIVFISSIGGFHPIPVSIYKM